MTFLLSDFKLQFRYIQITLKSVSLQFDLSFNSTIRIHRDLNATGNVSPLYYIPLIEYPTCISNYFQN